MFLLFLSKIVVQSLLHHSETSSSGASARISCLRAEADSISLLLKNDISTLASLSRLTSQEVYSPPSLCLPHSQLFDLSFFLDSITALHILLFIFLSIYFLYLSLLLCLYIFLLHCLSAFTPIITPLSSDQ